MITLKTYIYNGVPNKINKQLQENTEYKGLLNASFSILNPVVRFRTKTPVTFNYAYILELNRFYFVDNIQIDGDLCTVSLKVDVLTTYKEDILSSTGTLIKSDNANNYISNRENYYDLRPKLKKLVFPNNGLFVDNGKMIMITIKGN
mgnify:CR=1 FL=1